MYVLEYTGVFILTITILLLRPSKLTSNLLCSGVSLQPFIFLLNNLPSCHAVRPYHAVVEATMQLLPGEEEVP